MWTGVKLGTIAAKTAAVSIFRPEHAKSYLAQSLAKIPGLPAKFAQIMHMQDQEIVEANEVAAMSVEQVKSILKSTNPKLLDLIDTIDPQCVAASLGQVHRIQLVDGRTMAMKVQYPGVRESLKSQIKLFTKSMALSPAKNFGLDTKAYEVFLEQKFFEETDYTLEAMNQDCFYTQFADNENIIIPKVDLELTNSQVLIQTFESSIALKDLKNYPLADRRKAAQCVADFMIEQIFKNTILHTDFHEGNWGIRLDSRKTSLVLYDYGSYLEVDQKQTRVLLAMARFSKDSKAYSPYNAFCSLGFKPTQLEPLAPKLPAICEKLFSPLEAESYWDPNDWQLGKHFKNILAEDAWWFRTAGPPWFLYFMRTVGGYINALTTLNAPISFRGQFEALTEGLMASKDSDFTDFSQHLKQQARLSTDCARYLKVLIKEGDKEIVSLELPCRVVDQLEELLPQSSEVKKEQQNFDLQKIKAQVQSNGYFPQILFETNENGRCYKVWLE